MVERNVLRWPVAAVLVLLLPACSIYSLPGGGSPAPPPAPPPAPAPDSPAVPPPAAERPAPTPGDRGVIAAYTPLLQRAEEATARGDYEQALTLLERAQRIDPDNARIYLAMASTHAARGDTRRARATAERGLLYCEGDTECAALRRYTR